MTGTKLRRLLVRIAWAFLGWIVLIGVGLDAGLTVEAAFWQTVFAAVVAVSCYGFYKLLEWSDFGG